MFLSRSHSANLLLGFFIGIGLIVVASLPVLAGEPDTSQASPSAITSTFTSTDTPQPSETPTPTSTPTVPISPTIAITSTETVTPTFTATSTATPTQTPTAIAEVAGSPYIYLPILANNPYVPIIPTTALFCDSLGNAVSIPDNYTNGINDYISISDGRVLVDANLYLDISHTWVGDLVVSLANQSTGQSITVLNRPGTLPYGCGNNDIVAILDDEAAQPADEQCASYPRAISGIYIPIESLSAFAGGQVAGTWRLNVSDRYPNDTGALNHWCLVTKVADSMPPPTPTPTPVNLPSSASVSGMTGQDQLYNLDCESRSAVDWAKHFGFSISETDFLSHLPRSDDPEVGFVGDPDGVFGYMPPNDYGVHAPPVASLLRDYGLTAQDFRSLRWDDLRSEIASGHPAIVWIISGANYSLVNGTPHIYTAASTNQTTIVAPYEHTVILVGYTSSTVTVLNGSRLVTLSLDQFLDSWSVLNFMAVLARP